jgi:hypothetical protein
MAGAGGYQQPTNPAPVSGPGNLARRTDGGPGAKQPMMTLPDAKYGEAKAFKQQEQGAPMAALGGMPGAGAPSGPGGPGAGAPSGPPGGAPMDMPTPLSDPTMRPFEPVTHGADAGPGPGTASLGLNPQPNAGKISDLISRYSGSDMSGGLGDLYRIAQSQGW